jgi:hypothetical protein
MVRVSATERSDNAPVRHSPGAAWRPVRVAHGNVNESTVLQFSVLVTTVYRSLMASVMPVDVPFTTMERARDTLGADAQGRGWSAESIRRAT